ncbi:MAG: hypothetical protein EZS28_001399 [Streblomastix strix]|uniref:Uncharacterized protein n=1 Tax=Streblomastix strix TaxID=222440 RepID=A0A5J4X787_9EUKA|nr:MAG: hypothetical protein EZS28_001399 [Streblomastix strix]
MKANLAHVFTILDMVQVKSKKRKQQSNMPELNYLNIRLAQVQEQFNTDCILYIVRMTSSESDSEEQSKEKEQSTAYWNNSKKIYRQDDASNSKGGGQNYKTRYNYRDQYRSQKRGQRAGRGEFVEEATKETGIEAAQQK